MQQSQARKQKTVVDLSRNSRTTSLARSVQRSPPSKKPVQHIDPLDFPPMSQSAVPVQTLPTWVTPSNKVMSGSDDSSSCSDNQ